MQRQLPKEIKTLDDLFAQAAHYSEWNLRERGSVRPTMFIVGDEGPSLMVYGKAMEDEKGKDELVQVCQLFCIAHAATASVIALESWMKFGPKDKIDQNEMPSESIDRKEVVVLMGETREGGRSKLLRIVRNGNGKFFNLVDDPDAPEMAGRPVAGRFSHLLPDMNTKRQSDCDLQVAAKLLLENMGYRIGRKGGR